MKKVKGLYPILLIALCISCISISIGFSAMSTSLSINGNAVIDPIGMIRITSIEQKNISNATEYYSDYGFENINVQLDIDNNGYATYNVEVKNLGEVDEQLSKIEPEIFSNDDMTYEIEGIELGTVIKKKEDLNFTVTFKTKNGVVNDKKLNAKIVFKFKKYEKTIINSSDYYQADGECLFNGKGKNIIGECAKGNDVDYINTNITPFSEDNYLRNFILKFTIKDVDSSRFKANGRDTIFNILYEADDKIKGKYPGVLLRIDNGKWLLQGSSGATSNYSTKLSFGINELLNKEIKIIRYNNKGKILLYYVIGDSSPKLLKDITDLYSPFDTPLTFGANLEIDNKTSGRHSYATLENILFKYADEYSSLSELVNDKVEEVVVTPPQTQLEQFNLTGPCIFSGSISNITGDACSTYHDSLYVNTGIKLFDEENYKKDFELSFDISEYDNGAQEFDQATLMNSFLERTGKGYGMLLRKNQTNLHLIIRDGKGTNHEVNFPYKNISSIKIVRKNNNICYSINNGDMQFAIDSSNLEAPFNVPVTFGGSIDKEGQPFRYIKGTLSNMKIVVGQVDNDIICRK